MAKAKGKRDPLKNQSATHLLLKEYNTPAELATFYTNGATPRERGMITKFLNKSPDRYAKEVRGHIDYILGLRAKSSQLETTPSPKILELTPERKKQIIDTYRSMHPEELASYYMMMGHSERYFVYIEVLPLQIPNYQEKFWFYINHPLELRNRLKGLEKKTQTTTDR